MYLLNGLVAQPGERRVRNAEVKGSIPSGSTIKRRCFLQRLLVIFAFGEIYTGCDIWLRQVLLPYGQINGEYNTTAK